MAYSHTIMYLHLVKNGVYINQIFSNDGFADSSTKTVNLELQANDEVWIRNGGGQDSQLHIGDYNCFSGMLVRES
ncbi:hypothetical protein FSP39_020164 [Pinctada imbricata]|uniref:C1q domain-containing protein n=1 Tax=Pinctada imbricata TaxID=66713 RepID=A0AA88YPA0_PINIB|nr:hypothetical protein FSP39_020164 [Pinctada imbricata]